MKTALFIMLPVPSHYNACFGLANNLREQGYRVVFTGTPDLREHVELQGFGFAVLWCLEEYVIHNWRVGLGLFLKNAIDSRFKQLRYREFLTAVAAVRQLCQKVEPNEVFIDQHLNHYYFLLQAKYSKITLINTKLPTRQAVGIPPLTCSVPFKQNSAYRLFAKILWLNYLAQRSAANSLKKVVFWGTDDQSLLAHYTKKHSVDIDQYRRLDNVMYESLKGVPIIHVRPRFLEYDWYESDSYEQFCYFPYQRQAAQLLESTEIWSVLQEVRKVESEKKQKQRLLYASLGTLSGLHEADGLQFFHRLIEAVEGLPNTWLIVSAGELYRKLIGRQTPKVTLMKRVPQTELLPHCNLMVTHAGMNSICECLTAGVPVLTYPLNMRSDQPGNAARVVAKGWGLQGSLRYDTPRSMKRKIMQLLADPVFQRSVGQTNMKPINDWHWTMDLAESR